MPNLFRVGGYVACLILIAGGIATIVIGLDGRDTVTHDLEREGITGTPDMTPDDIQAEVKKAGLKDVEIPDCSVADQPIDTGSRAHCFAEYIRIHALEATGGYVYAEMGQFEAKPGAPKSQLEPGGGTSNEKFAVIDPETGAPAPNTDRNVWVTATALSTALNTSYFANNVANFAIWMGVAVILIGIGLLVNLLGLVQLGGRSARSTR
jgi:hypothetical protein